MRPRLRTEPRPRPAQPPQRNRAPVHAPHRLPSTPPNRTPHPQVFWAFFLDCGLFSVWQAVMLSSAPAPYRFVPLLGLGAWLVKGGGTAAERE